MSPNMEATVLVVLMLVGYVVWVYLYLWHIRPKRRLPGAAIDDG